MLRECTWAVLAVETSVPFICAVTAEGSLPTTISVILFYTKWKDHVDFTMFIKAVTDPNTPMLDSTL